MTKSDGSKLYWFIQKPTTNNCPVGQSGPLGGVSAVFQTFEPTVGLQGCEWIKVGLFADYLQEKQAREFAEGVLRKCNEHVLPGTTDTSDGYKIELIEAIKAREKAEAERDELKYELKFIQTLRGQDEFINSLKEEIACLRSVLGEISEHPIWPSGPEWGRFDHFVQWHRAQELAEERKKTD